MLLDGYSKFIRRVEGGSQTDDSEAERSRSWQREIADQLFGDPRTRSDRMEVLERVSTPSGQRYSHPQVGVYFDDTVTFDSDEDTEPSVSNTQGEQQERVRPDVERSRVGSESFHFRIRNDGSLWFVRSTT